MKSIRTVLALFIFLGLIGCTTQRENSSANSGLTKTSSNNTNGASQSVDCGNRTAEQCFLYGKSFVSEENEDKDYNKAREYYLKASEMGYAPADVALGWLYFSRDFEFDLDSALFYMKRAADKNEVEGYCGMGILRSMASHPSIIDFEEAESWFLKGAKKRHYTCTFMLANLYQSPDWDKRDLEKSYSFFLILTAFRDNDKGNIIGAGPQQHMAYLRKKLRPDQEYAASQWAIQWLQKNAPLVKK